MLPEGDGEKFSLETTVVRDGTGGLGKRFGSTEGVADLTERGVRTGVEPRLGVEEGESGALPNGARGGSIVGCGSGLRDEVSLPGEGDLEDGGHSSSLLSSSVPSASRLALSDSSPLSCRSRVSCTRTSSPSSTSITRVFGTVKGPNTMTKCVGEEFLVRALAMAVERAAKVECRSDDSVESASTISCLFFLAFCFEPLPSDVCMRGN